MGSGLTLWGNAVAVLRALGLGDALQEVGVVSTRFEVQDHRGATLSRADLALLGQRLGAPNLCVHRTDLLGLLLDALGRERVECGRRVVGLDRARGHGGVQARFEGGAVEEGVALVGADGLGSAVRAALHGPADPVYRGYTCWRGVVDLDPPALPPGLVREVWGPGRRVGLNRCRPGQVFVYATCNRPAGQPDPPGGRQAELRALFEGWPDPVPAVFEALGDATILRHDIVDRPVLRRWGRGPVTLLGDAAHPMTPNWGQGACQAIEDAWVLGQELGRGGDATLALRRYEARRTHRANRLVVESRRVGQVGQLESRALTWLRDRVVGLASGWSQREYQRVFGAGMAGLELPG